MEDQAMYMEQLNHHLYREAKNNWDQTPAKERKGPAPTEPKRLFETDEPGKLDRSYIPADIGETIPVEEN